MACLERTQSLPGVGTIGRVDTLDPERVFRTESGNTKEYEELVSPPRLDAALCFFARWLASVQSVRALGRC